MAKATVKTSKRRLGVSDNDSQPCTPSAHLLQRAVRSVKRSAALLATEQAEDLEELVLAMEEELECKIQVPEVPMSRAA